MTKKAIKYAMKRLLLIGNDNNQVTFREKTDQLGIYVEFRCGKNVSISDDEIYYQAEEYLDDEKRELTNHLPDNLKLSYQKTKKEH